MISRLTLVRSVVAVFGLVLAVLLLGPDTHLEDQLGISDKVAHAGAFYALTLGLFGCFPYIRRTDLGLFVILIGASTEVVQAFVGRDGNFPDFAADSMGILGAMLPATVERIRISIRHAPTAAASGLKQA
jgi:VanZ family protein